MDREAAVEVSNRRMVEVYGGKGLLHRDAGTLTVWDNHRRSTLRPTPVSVSSSLGRDLGEPVLEREE